MSAKGYVRQTPANQYGGDRKVLVMCCSGTQFKLANGKIFSTGHNPTELMVPVIHLSDVGIECDFATETGEPVSYEKWAIADRPYAKDLADEISAQEAKLNKPIKFADLPDNVADTYMAVFLPGGHGTMIDMHKSTKLGAILRECHANDLTTAIICHGINGMRAAAQPDSSFIYDGYTMCGFPDKGDKEGVAFGYLPGKQIEFQQEELNKLGPNIIWANKSDDTICVDRELLTGQSQHGAHFFGLKLVEILLALAPQAQRMRKADGWGEVVVAKGTELEMELDVRT
jgi:molecular chaperone Hsp31 and glyoxalase 3